MRIQILILGFKGLIIQCFVFKMLHCLFSSRNFPDQFDQNKAAVESGLQKETLIVKKWIDENPFVLSANFHGGSLVANYPYDDTPNKRSVYSATTDDDIFRKLALTYSSNHPTMHLNKAQCVGDNFKDGKICTLSLGLHVITLLYFTIRLSMIVRVPVAVDSLNDNIK